MNAPEWRLAVFPFIFGPLMIGKLLWSLGDGLTPSLADWVILTLTLGPWVWLALWLRRPTSP
jgi:hypothetical protein